MDAYQQNASCHTMTQKSAGDHLPLKSSLLFPIKTNSATGPIYITIHDYNSLQMTPAVYSSNQAFYYRCII